jgi:hypothetical protein
MHPYEYTCKTPKTGTLLRMTCKNLNHNEVQPQTKQRNKGKKHKQSQILCTRIQWLLGKQ